MTAGVESRLRTLAIALPQTETETETEEKLAWGDSTFRVRDRIFAMIKPRDGRSSVWMKAPEEMQEMLIDAAPEPFFRPPYVGHRGGIGLRLDASSDWEEVAHHLRRSWRMTAPERLAAAHPDIGA